MNTKLIKILLAGAVVALGCSKALATPFSGTIAFDGTVTLNGTIAASTAVLSFTNPEVSTGTHDGAYAVVPDNYAVTMKPFTFLPVLSPDPLYKLWDFTYLGVEYSFDLYGPISVTKVLTGIPTLTIEGNGWAHIGLDSARGAWILTTQGRASKLSFSSYTVVPDGGTTALLLGLGLLSVGLAVRRSKSSKA